MRRAVALAAVALLAGCGGGGGSEADATADYIEAANRIQAELEPAHRQAQAAIRAFANGRSGARNAERLQAASSSMRAARAAVARLTPPLQARRLHERLLELLELQATVALELSLASEYLPQAVAGIGPVDAAGAALGRALRAAAGGAEQVAALQAYEERIEEALSALQRLAPPPVLRPWQNAQVQRVESSLALARGLRRGIENGDPAAIERAQTAFAEQAPDPRSAQRAQAEAVKAFNARLARQERLVAAIAREQAELVERFGG